MLNIHLKVTTEKKQQSQNFDFLCLKSSSSGMAFLLFLFWKELWRFKVKALNENVIIKMKQNWKWKMPHSFREMSLVLQLI